MAQTSTFWEAWSPYLSDLENNHLDVETIDTLAEAIRDPVLIVGAGQGLLVDQLRKKGFQVDGVDACSQMVEYAEERRGLKLVQADAVDLPFGDGSYRTTIIATGVVDFLEDEERIRCIVDEAIRVTEAAGRVLVAFYKVHPAAERFLTRIGVIMENGTLRHRRVFEMSRQTPGQFIATCRKEGNLGFLEAIGDLARMQFSLPKRERVINRNLTRILKSAPNADELIESVSESIPYRNAERIADLFQRLDVPVNGMKAFAPCVVVELGLAR